jgi:hypothetical protein
MNKEVESSLIKNTPTQGRKALGKFEFNILYPHTRRMRNND